MKHSGLIFICIALLLTTACSRSFEPIDYGKEACAHCKMTILDNRFSAELITAKGKIYKFDDILCLMHFEKEHPQQEGKLVFVSDYKLGDKETMLEAGKAVFLKHDFFKSPMNGYYAAFSSQEEARPLMDSLKVAPLTLDNLH